MTDERCKEKNGEGPTPRTDYAATLVQFAVAGKDQYEVVSAEFARQLERQLASWKLLAEQNAETAATALKQRDAAQSARGTCEWLEDEDGVWHTGCGEAWVFTDGGMKDHGFKFCYHCGSVAIDGKAKP